MEKRGESRPRSHERVWLGFTRAKLTPNLLAQRSESERLESYRRLRERLGSVNLEEPLAGDPRRLVVRLGSTKGPRPFFVFTSASGASGLLIDNVVAEFGPVLPLSLLDSRSPSTPTPAIASSRDPASIIARLDAYFTEALTRQDVPASPSRS